SISARNCTTGLDVQLAQNADLDTHLSVGMLEATNATWAQDIGGQSYVSVGEVVADTCSDAVTRITGTPSLRMGNVIKDQATPAYWSATSGGLVPTLSNGWTQVASNDPFSVDLQGG